MKEYNESQKEIWGKLEKKGFNRLCSAVDENLPFPICWISPCQKLMIEHPFTNPENYQIKSVSIYDYLTIGNKLNWELEGDINFIENQLNKYYENKICKL